jgi:ADP-dependent NAD(P)H-hydrate dehydratase
MSPSRRSSSHAVEVTRRVLGSLPLPAPSEEGDKYERGVVLVVAGATELPGAAVLAATAALRAGAGKLRIATCRSVAAHVGVTVPESRVYALPETKKGEISAAAAPRILELAARADALLVGPGMLGASPVSRIVGRVLDEIDRPTLVLDAAALAAAAGQGERLARLGGRVVLTPHAGEMAKLTGIDRDEIREDPAGTAARCARVLGAVVALKGRETFVAAPDGRLFVNRAGNVGLATSGSGDTLAGVVAGLCARGADPLAAAVWGVFLHASAGDALAERVGPLGFLARELLDEIPRLMSAFARN